MNRLILGSYLEAVTLYVIYGQESALAPTQSPKIRTGRLHDQVEGIFRATHVHTYPHIHIYITDLNIPFINKNKRYPYTHSLTQTRPSKLICLLINLKSSSSTCSDHIKYISVQTKVLTSVACHHAQRFSELESA